MPFHRKVIFRQFEIVKILPEWYFDRRIGLLADVFVTNRTFVTNLSDHLNLSPPCPYVLIGRNYSKTGDQLVREKKYKKFRC